MHYQTDFEREFAGPQYPVRAAKLEDCRYLLWYRVCARRAASSVGLHYRTDKTRIWLLELAEGVPSTTHLDGFDLNVSQTPPKEWLPANVTFKYFDIFEDVPEQFIESYDIIHVQLTLTFVKDDKFRTVLQNVLKMLSEFQNLLARCNWLLNQTFRALVLTADILDTEPGGFIQWIEGDYAHVQFFSSDPGTQPKEIELVMVECFQMMNLVAPR